MKTMDLVLLAGLALLALGGSASLSPSGSSGSAAPANQITGQTYITPTGQRKTTPNAATAHQVAGIQKIEGANTPITVGVGGNPLFVAYQPGGTVTPNVLFSGSSTNVASAYGNLTKLRISAPSTFISARQPTTSAEHEAATHTNAIRALSESTGISQSAAFDLLNK